MITYLLTKEKFLYSKIDQINKKLKNILFLENKEKIIKLL
jgi:hypothetical protein